MIFALLLIANSAELTDAQVVERLQFIEQRIGTGTSEAQLWFGAWTGIYGALTVGATTLALVLPEREQKVSYTGGAIASFVGVLSMVAQPLPSAFAKRALAKLPESTPEERRKKLDEAERWLQNAAGNEAFVRSWMQEVGAVFVSVGLGFVLSFGYHYYSDAALDLFSGMVLSQLQIITAPTQAVRDRDEYNQRFHRQAPKKITWHLGVFPGGLSAIGSF